MFDCCCRARGTFRYLADERVGLRSGKHVFPSGGRVLLRLRGNRHPLRFYFAGAEPGFISETHTHEMTINIVIIGTRSSIRLRRTDNTTS